MVRICQRRTITPTLIRLIDAQPPFTSPSMKDCMDHCSRYWNTAVGEGCFGVVWIEKDGECWIRNSTTSAKPLTPEAGTHSALVVKGNMDGFDTTCPGQDQSVNTLSGIDGLKYTLNCGKVISGFDVCFSGYNSACWDTPYKGYYHTKTLDECLRICVDQHPLCKGVSWSADLAIGFANCWPKTGFPDGGLPSPGAKQGVIHSATITQLDSIDRSCPSNKNYKVQGTNKNFEVHCNQLNAGTNMTSLHTQNITSCMDACAKNNQGCIGVVFDSALTSGFKNCYLQNSTNTISDNPSATYAALTSGSTGSGGGSGSGSNDSGSSSKAWIAGPVLGGIAAIGLIAFAIFWFRRRKAQQGSAGPVEKDGHEFGHYGPAPAYSPGGHDPRGQAQYFDNSPMHAPVTELSGNSHAANELPASTKYAHAHTGKTEAAELPS